MDSIDTVGVERSDVLMKIVASPKMRSNNDCENVVSFTRYSSNSSLWRDKTPCEILNRCVVSSYSIDRTRSQRQAATNTGITSQLNRPQTMNV